MKFDPQEVLSQKVIPDHLLVRPTPGPWPPGPPRPAELGPDPGGATARAARLARVRELARRDSGARWFGQPVEWAWDGLAHGDAMDEWSGAPYAEGEFARMLGEVRNLKDSWNVDSSIWSFGRMASDWGQRPHVAEVDLARGKLVKVKETALSFEAQRGLAGLLHGERSAWRSHGLRADETAPRGWPRWFGIEVVAWHPKRRYWIVDESDRSCAEVEAPTLALAVALWLHQGGWVRTEEVNQALAQEWKRHARGLRLSAARAKAGHHADLAEVLDAHLVTGGHGEATRLADGSVPDCGHDHDEEDGSEEAPEDF